MTEHLLVIKTIPLHINIGQAENHQNGGTFPTGKGPLEAGC